jgi:addiction module HigA family antidote
VLDQINLWIYVCGYSPINNVAVSKLLPLFKIGLQTAKNLNVARKTVSALVNGKIGGSPEMALRLELAFGKSAESWLAAQAALRFVEITSQA